MKKIYQCYTGVADLFIYFYERGIKLLKPGGQFAFITSNKWYRSGYGEKLRSYLAAETRLHGLIDFGDAPVFDAIAYPTIVLLERNPPPAEANFRGYTWQPGPPVEEFATIFRKQAFDIPQTSLHKGGWRLEDSAKRNLLDKLRAGGTPLGEYCEGRFYYGIKTGLNDAFVVDRETRDRLISEHKSSDAVLKPFLRGRDVKRWRVEPKDLWLIKLESSANATHPWTGQSDNVAEKTYAKTYPAIHAFHQQFRDGLIKREDQGKYYWELRSCIYWQEFEQPKIVYPDIAPDCTFASDTTSLLLDCTLYMIPEAPLYFLPILNSSANNYFINQICPAIRGGYRRFKSIYMTQIPIPAASVAERAALDKLVQTIVKSKEANASADVLAWEAEINARVYSLFDLTPDEIAVIEAMA